jgi:hypothetical protein
MAIVAAAAVVAAGVLPGRPVLSSLPRLLLLLLLLSVCQVAMIECSPAIITRINHHPLKRVNNILQQQLKAADCLELYTGIA